jgi:pseudaminic acid cytidylyltransferase
MIKNTIAIITARGGSKRMPGKNIRNFMGQPIIGYSIKAAIGSDCFDEVMVSTDDDAIAKLATGLGAKVPFMRSAKNSDDHATTEDVILEVLKEYGKNGIQFEYGCCLYPTAPFVNAARLQQGYNLLKTSGASSLIPVTKFSYPILRSLKLEAGKLVMNWPEHISTRSQDLAPAYHDVGQFYFFKVSEFLLYPELFTSNTIPMEIPESEVQDIDNEEDWKLAEIKYAYLQQKKDSHV